MKWCFLLVWEFRDKMCLQGYTLHELLLMIFPISQTIFELLLKHQTSNKNHAIVVSSLQPSVPPYFVMSQRSNVAWILHAGNKGWINVAICTRHSRHQACPFLRNSLCNSSVKKHLLDCYFC